MLPLLLLRLAEVEEIVKIEVCKMCRAVFKRILSRPSDELDSAVAWPDPVRRFRKGHAQVSVIRGDGEAVFAA